MKRVLLMITFALLLVPGIAQADEAEDLRTELDELTELIEELIERIEFLEEQLDRDNSVEVIDVENNDETNEQSSGTSSALQLEEELNNQEVIIENVFYNIQDENLKNLYPDMLASIATNNSDNDIRDVTYAFVAWDSNGLPVKIKGRTDFSGGNYVHLATRENVNVTPGESFGDGYGVHLDTSMSDIYTMKAIIVEYQGFNNETWTNPLYEDFINIYEGKRLVDIEGHEETVFNR